MRLFVAFEIPESQRCLLVQKIEPLRGALPRARWVKLENLHLTLIFLGDTDPSRLTGLDEALTTTFAPWPPMTLQLMGSGAFPAGARSRVAWIGVETQGDLVTLQKEVALAAVVAADAEADPRPYHAHITVARCSPPWPQAATARFLETFSGPLGDEFVVQRGVLIESHLSSAGTRYRVVSEYALRG